MGCIRANFKYSCRGRGDYFRSVASHPLTAHPLLCYNGCVGRDKDLTAQNRVATTTAKANRPDKENTMKTNTTANTELVRANKLTVKVDGNGNLVADLFRTHKHIATIRVEDTGFVPNPDSTKSAIREDFRKFVAEYAADWGIDYDPTDRRTEANLRKATYKTEADVIEDAIAMVTPDIEAFIAKMPHGDLVGCYTISVESLTAKTQTSKGTDLALMGIENGRYASNGNMAWFDIEGLVTMKCGDTEIYQTIKMELVSGQLKKFRMTQTQWNTETTQSMVEAGLVEEKPKAEKSAKAETPKAEEPKESKPAKKSRKSKKSEEKVEG